ncbi:MAG: phosphate ABC transporter substrate-binding protein [Usitatibacter sp.]
MHIAGRILLAAIFCAAFNPLPALAQRNATPLSGALVVTGSTTLLPVITELAASFQARHHGVRIDVRGGGSGRGMSDVLAGSADIGMMSRALRPEEKVASFAVARDGVCLVVHRDNPVNMLNREQARGIFTGRIVNWKSVGGRDEPIELVTRGTERGASALLTEFLGLDYAAFRARREVGDNLEIIPEISKSPAALAYVSLGLAQSSERAGAAIKRLAVQGVDATSASLRSGDSPLSRPLILVTRETPRGLARAFIEFALSRQAAAVIVKNDFIPYPD